MESSSGMLEVFTNYFLPQKGMTARTSPTTTSPIGHQVGDASEDGDFVALRENRENRVPEPLELSTVTLTEILESVNDPRPSPTTVRSGILAAQQKSDVGGAASWAELTEALMSGPEEFKYVLNKIGDTTNLCSKAYLDPRNNQNILHCAVEINMGLASLVLERGHEDLIHQQFDVSVSNIAGKKNVLHQAVEQNDPALLNMLLSNISNPQKRIALLSQETPIAIKGQRPRTFPCLHLAAYHGFTEIVAVIVGQGVDVNHVNAKKDTSLLWASRWNHLATIRALLQLGALPNVENDKGSTALNWAVRYGHAEAVDILVREGNANVNQTRKFGFVAPIVLASVLGFSDTVSILLEFGADPNFAIRGGERPIHHAGREGFSKIIKILVAKGAKIDAVDDRGDTALLLTAKHGRPAALQTLLQLGANVNHKNLEDEDVWKFAVRNDDEIILKLLVIHQRKKELEIIDDAKIKYGINSLLILAASIGDLKKMKLLHAMRVDVRATDEDGNNFLHVAAINNQAQVIKEFHKMVNINSANKFGNTALHEACAKGHHEAVMELIQCKAMVNIKNSQGQTALHVAAAAKSIQALTVSMLVDYIIKSHPWEVLNIRDNEGNSPLHIASRHASAHVLWEFRFIRFKVENVLGNKALHEAVRPGEPEILEMMLNIFDAMKRDCDINHQNKKLQTCLHLAAREGFLDSVKRLMFFGADISLADHKGNTVLHMLTSITVTDPAHSSRYLDIIAIILERALQWYSSMKKIKLTDSKDQQAVIRRKAILNLLCEMSNNEDLSVLDLACKMGASDVVKFFVSMDDVMAFKAGKYVRYDITGITPRTNEKCGGMFVKGQPSCLEWLLASGHDTPQNAAKILDLQPFSDIEKAYSSVVAWAYLIIMIVHIIYMSLFSWSGLTLLYNSRTIPGERDNDAPTLVTYIIVPLEPAFFVFYNTYKLCCMGELSIKSKLSQGGPVAQLTTLMSVIVGLVYSIFVITWIITYAVDYSYMDYFLAIALCIGWMFTISLTRGFKVINYFWRLIQIMIIRDVLKFLFIYLFVLLAFTFAFHALFQVSATLSDLYPNPLYTVFLMFNMLIGMEYVFEYGVVDEGLSSLSRSTLFMKILYVIYMVLATIVLLNLLIAMMNGSYQEILRKQTQTWRIESVQLGVDVERIMPLTFPVFSKVKITKGFICPSDQTIGVIRWYIELAKVKQSVCQCGAHEDKEKAVLAVLASKMATMAEQIQSLKTNVDGIYAMMTNNQDQTSAIDKQKIKHTVISGENN